MLIWQWTCKSNIVFSPAPRFFPAPFLCFPPPVFCCSLPKNMCPSADFVSADKWFRVRNHRCRIRNHEIRVRGHMSPDDSELGFPCPTRAQKWHWCIYTSTYAEKSEIYGRLLYIYTNVTFGSGWAAASHGRNQLVTVASNTKSRGREWEILRN